MSGITSTQGAKSGMVGAITTSIWYQAQSVGTHNVATGNYVASANMETYSGYCTGVVLHEMRKIIGMKAYTMDNQNYHAPYGEQALTLEWDMAGATAAQARTTHHLASTTISGTWQQANTYNRYKDIMSVGSAGSRFEDLAQPNDSFGFRFNRTSNVALLLYGVMITYELNKSTRTS